MAPQVSKNIQALADAAEEKRSQQEQGLDPYLLAGRGLGTTAFAAQTGRVPAEQINKLGSFAQKVADFDAARLNTQTPTPTARVRVGQPSLKTAQSAVQETLQKAAARRGPSAVAGSGQFANNLLRTAGTAARSSALIRLLPFLAVAPNKIGDSTLTGNNRALGPIDQMATDQYQAMMAQESLMNPPSAAEAGENLINIGNSLFPQEQPANLMTPELRDERAAERQRKYGDIEQNPNAIGRFVQDVFNTPKELGRRFDEFTGTLMRAATPEEELGYTPPSFGDLLATAGITDPEGNVFGSGGRKEPRTGPTRLPPAPITAVSETPAPKIATPTDGMDITQRAIADAMDRTAKTDAQRAELSPAQRNFLARKDKGTPLTPDEINAAQRYAVSQGQIFDPETGYSQAEFYGQRYKGQSIGDYLRGADTPDQATEQFVDPQGRLRRRMAGTDQLAPEYSSYEKESAAREARLAARPDFMEAQPSQARKDGVMSKAQALKLSGGNRKKADQMIELQKMGRDPITGQLEEQDGPTVFQTETLRQNQERIKQEQERIDLAKQQAEDARKAAEAKGATQAQKDAYDIAQKEVDLAITYQKFQQDKEKNKQAPVFDADEIAADLDGIQSQLDIVWDPEAGVFRRGKWSGKGEVIKIDDPKNASIVRTIGTYKVGRALLDIYPKKG